MLRMQIEDSHRDYYDYACPHLIDKAIVYHRNSQVVLGQELFFNPNPFHIDEEKWFNRFNLVVTKDEPVQDSRTNTEKILSAGFDTKTSFRNVK